MNELRTPVSEPELREQATIRLRKKRDFRAHLLAYLLCNGSLLIIWALTGAGIFWPVFPMLAWASAWCSTPGTSSGRRSASSRSSGR